MRGGPFSGVRERHSPVAALLPLLSASFEPSGERSDTILRSRAWAVLTGSGYRAWWGYPSTALGSRAATSRTSDQTTAVLSPPAEPSPLWLWPKDTVTITTQEGQPAQDFSLPCSGDNCAPPALRPPGSSFHPCGPSLALDFACLIPFCITKESKLRGQLGKSQKAPSRLQKAK